MTFNPASSAAPNNCATVVSSAPSNPISAPPKPRTETCIPVLPKARFSMSEKVEHDCSLSRVDRSLHGRFEPSAPLPSHRARDCSIHLTSVSCHTFNLVLKAIPEDTLPHLGSHW